MSPTWMSNYEMSRNVFDSTLKEPAPGEIRFFWTDLQAALNRWSNIEYGYQPAEARVLGLAEEYAEFLAATNVKGKIDAVGDMSLCLIQLCNVHRLDAGVLIGNKEEMGHGTSSAPSWIGRLAHIELKYLQGIRGMRDQIGFENRDVVRTNVALNAAGLFRWLQEATMRMFISHPRVFTGTAETVYEDLVRGIANEVMARRKNLLPQVLGLRE